MKNKIFIIIILAAIITGGWIAITHLKKPSQDQSQGVQDIYYCPMHPHYTSDHPGNCPICGMKLVKKEGHPSQEHALQEHLQASAVAVQGYVPVSLTGAKQQLIGIKIATVVKENAVKTIRAAGYISTNHDLYLIQNEYIQNYTDFVTAYRDYKRFEYTRRNWESHRQVQLKLHEAEDKLLRLGLGPMQIEQLQKFSWKTPWDQAGLLFFKNDVGYWVTVQIFEGDLGFVEVGQEVDIDISAYGEKAKGVIRSIGGSIDPQTRTANALIELKGYRGELKGNMFVNAAIRVELNEVIAVPREAVMDTGVRKIVFVQKDEGTFEPRVIQTGWETDDGFEVKSGLKIGEKIVTSGNFLLDSESRVQAGLEDATKADTTVGGGNSHGQ